MWPNSVIIKAISGFPDSSRNFQEIVSCSGKVARFTRLAGRLICHFGRFGRFERLILHFERFERLTTTRGPAKAL
jgi:hypothetical protein